MRNFTIFRNAGILTSMIAVLCGCSSEEPKKKPPETPKQENKQVAYTGKQAPSPGAIDVKVFKAHCVLSPKGEHAVIGAITFMQLDDGVRIIADVAGLSPGKHGFHIHEHGDCSAVDAASAGGHFNPLNKKHGGPDSSERHLGDLGNLEANRSGFAHYDRVDKEISLNGPNSIIGKSIIVHADEDDLKTDPTGNSGARIACGEIIISK